MLFRSVPVPEISTVASLLIIVGILVGTVLLSLWKDARDRARGMVSTKIIKADYDDFGNRHHVDEEGYMIDEEGHQLDWDGKPLTEKGADPSAGHLH